MSANNNQIKPPARPLLHTIWNPYHGLWTYPAGTFANKIGLRNVLVGLDSAILLARCVAARARRLGLASVFSNPRTSLPVVILDAGLHRKAKQIKKACYWLKASGADYRVFGFEAHPGFAQESKHALSDFRIAMVFNLALVGPEYDQDTIDLFVTDRSDGVGNNVLAPDQLEGATQSIIKVPAVRLSSFLKQKRIDPDRTCILFRMNIEGPEFDVLRDLQDAGTLTKIDGFFGAWDDLFKMASEREPAFRKFMKMHGISTIPFNDRNLGRKWPFRIRERAIRYAVRTALGFAELGKNRLGFAPQGAAATRAES